MTTNTDREPLTVADLVSLPIEELPPTIDSALAAEAFGVSYWHLLNQAKAGTAPVTPLRLGRNIRWPTAAVLRALGHDIGTSHETGVDAQVHQIA